MSECTKGPLSKVPPKGQGPSTSVSLLNIAANTWQSTRSSILTSSTILTIVHYLYYYSHSKGGRGKAKRGDVWVWSRDSCAGVYVTFALDVVGAKLNRGGRGLSIYRRPIIINPVK